MYNNDSYEKTMKSSYMARDAPSVAEFHKYLKITTELETRKQKILKFGFLC